MRKIVLIFLCCQSIKIHAQEIPLPAQQQLEMQAEKSGDQPDDDGWLMQMEEYGRHKININKADEADLRRLGILNEMQILAFMNYRRVMGEFLSVYELQAIPGWDQTLIRRLFPFISVSTLVTNREQIVNRLRKGEHSLLCRSFMDLKRSAGYFGDSSGKKYIGSPPHLFFRLRYHYKDLLQWGISGEKDAGEPLFKKGEAKGFDHYFFHFFLRRLGVIKALALGDFTVNLGQGLIQWQSLAFKRSAEVMNCKRQSDILRPYSSSGEFYYHRGAGMTISKRNWSLTGFLSFRQLDAKPYWDSLTNTWYVRSFLVSGYHRTKTENETRDRVAQLFYGGNISYEKQGWKLGLNLAAVHFSLPFRKQEEPYDRFAFEGKRNGNMSADIGYTWKNMHWFSELAIDAGLHRAILSGLLVSLDRKVDMSVLWRNIPASFQSIGGNAFTESASPCNEKGLYLGVSIRPRTDLKLDLYWDGFTSSWLRYRLHGPSSGSEFLFQLTYSPDKLTEIYGRFRSGQKQMNKGEGNYYSILMVPKQNYRWHVSRKLGQEFSIRERVDFIVYDRGGTDRQQGFSCYTDLLYRPPLKPLSLSARWQYFETEGTDAMVYAYENDVLYSFSIPGLSGKGKRYYLLAGYDLGKKTSIWLRLAATFYSGLDHIGEGEDLIRGNKKADYHFQVRHIF